MKRLVLLFALILVAVPLLAQDGGGGGGGADFGGLLGMGDGPRGGSNAPPPDRLVALRKILLDATVPLTKDQEKTLSTMLEKEIKQYTTVLEKKYPEEVAQARAASANGAGGGRGGFDRRGGGGGAGQPAGGAPAGGRGGGGAGGGRGGMAPNSPLAIEMKRINTELQGKVTGSLKPEQQAAFTKYQNDQVKKAGGFGALKLIMQEAGAALSPEQETQIQALYSEEVQQRQQLMRESQGQPDKAKVDALTGATMLKVTKVLTADQKKFFLEALKKQQQLQQQ